MIDEEKVAKKVRIRSATKVHTMAHTVASARTQIVGMRAAVTEHISQAISTLLGAWVVLRFGWYGVGAIVTVRLVLAVRSYFVWKRAAKDAP